MKTLKITFTSEQQCTATFDMLDRICPQRYSALNTGVVVKTNGEITQKYLLEVPEMWADTVQMVLQDMRVAVQEGTFVRQPEPQEPQRDTKFRNVAEKILHRLFQVQGGYIDITEGDGFDKEQITTYQTILADELYDFAVHVAQETYNADHDHYIDVDEAESRYIVPRRTIARGDV